MAYKIRISSITIKESNKVQVMREFTDAVPSDYDSLILRNVWRSIDDVGLQNVTGLARVELFDGNGASQKELSEKGQLTDLENGLGAANLNGRTEMIINAAATTAVTYDDSTDHVHGYVIDMAPAEFTGAKIELQFSGHIPARNSSNLSEMLCKGAFSYVRCYQSQIAENRAGNVKITIEFDVLDVV